MSNTEHNVDVECQLPSSSTPPLDQLFSLEPGKCRERRNHLPLFPAPHSHSARSASARSMSSPSLYPPLFRPGSCLECHPTALGQCHCGPCYYPQPRHRSHLKTSIRQEAACPRKCNFHWSPPALSRWSSGYEHAGSSLSSPTASIHSVNGSCSRAGYLDSS